GEVFFFYEGLRDNNNALAKVLRKGCYGKSAVFPKLENLHGGNEIREEVVNQKQGLFTFFKNWF
ncbi:MAG: hypothetical protein ACFCUV_25370, partial [Rivularia sp. (in: cyanobacteria)]